MIEILKIWRNRLDWETLFMIWFCSWIKSVNEWRQSIRRKFWLHVSITCSNLVSLEFPVIIQTSQLKLSGFLYFFLQLCSSLLGTPELQNSISGWKTKIFILYANSELFKTFLHLPCSSLWDNVTLYNLSIQ